MFLLLATEHRTSGCEWGVKHPQPAMLDRDETAVPILQVPRDETVSAVLANVPVVGV